MRKPKKLINRKYLKEIGINENHWPETLYTSDHSFIRDHREKEYLKHHQKVGVNPAETWNLCTTAMMWLYERLIEYRNYASEIVDLEMHRFKIDGKEFTQKEILDLLIKMAECILCEPENIKKGSAIWKRLEQNPYIEHCFKLSNCENSDYIDALEKRFWKIWAVVFPAMWW